jgi:hypothetical protein
MCFLIPSFFTSIFVIGAAILPAIGTGLAVGLSAFIVIIIFKSLFSSKKTETSPPHSITDSNKTYQLPDEEFDMTKEIVENKKELKSEETKVPTHKDEFKIVYFVIAATVLAVFVLFSYTDKEPKRIYLEHEATAPTEEKIEDAKPEIKEFTKENLPVIETKPTPDPTDSNYIKICNNGQLEGQGTCPKSPVLGSNPTDWACTKDKKTGLIWEVKTNDSGLRDKDWAYSWYESDHKKNGGFAGYKNGSSTVGSGGNCLTPDNCNTEDFVKEVNKQGLCGAKDFRMPTRDELLTLLHCAKNQNTSPKTDSDFNRLCTDEALKDAPNINKNYFPNTESHFWTSTLTNSDPWVVVFSYGGANADNKYFDSPVRMVRNDKPKSSKKTEKKMFINAVEKHARSVRGAFYPESLKIKTNGDISIATYVVEGACDNDTQSTIGTCGNHWEQYMIGLTDNNIIKPIEIGAKGGFAYETIKFVGNFIELDGKTVGEKDALCCPTIPMKKKFEISKVSKDGFYEITQ